MWCTALFTVLLALSSAVPSSLAINCKGCTPLDNLTFDKMIRSFPYSLVKFDTAYPYGDKHEEFAKVAVDGAEVADLFVGEVGIKDYGEKDNEDLGNRYGIKKDDYPAVMLFKRAKDGSDEVEEFQFAGEDFTAANLKNFLRQKTGVYLPLAGCIESLDAVADRMLGADKKDWEKMAKEAEEEAAKVPEKSRKRAETYVKIVRKIISDGEEFVKKETDRTKKLLDGKITEAKRTELQEKINILRSFTRVEEKKDEL